ncbi:DNA internalization-related competence protein ComEC/Rec2 [Pseudoalteromonas sp. DSM 26666]|uniref:DNA internalization-related competence protein ComEC/Rec2 n=1 Tax=Pseudoalteromonas sp. DSM 26666 TaxID=1761892 RepID=UPI000B8199C9|nr:DNA internalization-related competence protein ComEC/Rec2 [Pseudoalteromonas sp. DSM 26666]
MDRFFSHLKQPFTSVWMSLGFVIGVVVTVFYYQTLEFTVITISILIVSTYFKPFLTVLLGFICGICCVAAHFILFYSFELPNEHEKYAYSVNVVVEEVISSTPPQYVKVKITRLEDSEYSQFRAPNALLSINSTQPIQPGDAFTAQVRLKNFRGIKNFTVFDSQLYAFTQKIAFKGTVLNKQLAIYNRPQNNHIADYRTYVKKLVSSAELNWLYYVLLTGDKSLMTFEHKQLMQSLGLSHLLAISGLHISLVFGFCYFSVRCLLKLIKPELNQSLNIAIFYSAAGFVAAFIYVYLSDFIISATRALIMLGCYLLLYYLAKQALRWRSILYALVIILAVNPFSLLNPGLYFSFLAVCIIFMVLKQFPLRGHSLLANIRTLFVIQLGLFIGLLPLSLYFFNGVSLAGLVLNLVAIPILSFVLMPALFLSVLLGLLTDWHAFIVLYDFPLTYIYQMLLAIPQHIRWLNVGQVSITTVVLLYSVVPLLYFIELRVLACIPLLTLLSNYYFTQSSLWQLNVFDIGHGLMVLIKKDKHAFIYDFGPSYFNRFSRVPSVLLPYIDAHNLTVSTAIVSHQDNDHAGGVAHFKAAGYAWSFDYFHPNGVYNDCIATTRDFNGLSIQTFAKEEFNNSNDNSCIVKISAANYSVLLTGDISKTRESQLIKKKDDLQSTVLISPHHGSDSSSGDEFIKAVNPTIVIHSSAYQGQWQFPSKAVVERYNKINAKQYSTGDVGHVRVDFYAKHHELTTARAQESYWFIKD